MEVAGLAVGVAGLAGLFSCCTSAFRLVQQGRSFDKDYKIIETKFGNQELRLRAWGKACGLNTNARYDQRLDDPDLIQQVEATLECIKLLLGDAKDLQERYGLRSCSEYRSENSRPHLAIHSSSEGTAKIEPGRRASLNRLLSRRSLLQRIGSSPVLRTEQSSILSTAHWIIEDREKFSELVQHLRDFIDDLENFTKATEIPRRQRVFVEYEVESIEDLETLEDMESAREGDDDAVSDAASARLERISEGTASVRSSFGGGRSSVHTLQSIITLESLDSYFTARTHFSRPESIADPEYLVPTPELSRGAGLKRYGDAAVSNRLLRLQARPRNEREIFRRRHSRKSGNARPRLKVDGQSIDVALWDTTGQEDYDQLRGNSYSGTHVVIICFLIDAQEPNHDKVRNRWISEVNQRCPRAGRIIVGVEPDGSYQTSRIDITRGKRLAVEVNALHYIQCNLESGAGVDDVFEAASRASIASAEADDSRIWRLPWRDARQRLSIINENGVTSPSGPEDDSSSPSFKQKRHRKRLGLNSSSPPALTHPSTNLRDIEDSEEMLGRVKGNRPVRLSITNGDDGYIT
ncbi:Rho- BTB domain-containing protein 1 [Didymosphaeria variabile]|uniref:Rho- BTB domain-containing protein 1 n=1 Tax=Didymosphaeria variabile TaxID=1932322 RepID=A0A9W9C9U8_9PLEO|nr:Rho- BTB domain-containing protein 1 [Didymosphaeria variabile]KAJ4351432.1 Rho- BTB domain-containing protein 1 [Didymosphaeria variabile]